MKYPVQGDPNIIGYGASWSNAIKEEYCLRYMIMINNWNLSKTFEIAKYVMRNVRAH